MLLGLLCLLIIVAFLFMSLSHPLAMGLTLLLQTVVTALVAGLLTPSYWFSYILFLVFMGGMLVLFIYVTSLASNEMFELTLTKGVFSTLILVMPLSLAMSDPFPSKILCEVVPIFNHEALSAVLSKLYSHPTFLLTLVLIIYLLLTLVVIVYITSVHSGPLRQMN